MRSLGRTGDIDEIQRDSEELTVEWKIRNFFKLSGKGGDKYDSPCFDFRGVRWHLEMYPNGDAENPPSGCVDLFLARSYNGPPVTIQYTLSITGAMGVENRNEGKKRFSRYKTSWGFEFFTRHELRDYQSILMPDNLLTVRCILKNVEPSAAKGVSSYKDISSQTDGEFDESSACAGGSNTLKRQDASIQTDEEFREAKALCHSFEKEETSTQTDNSLGTEVLTQAQQSAEKQGIEKAMEDIRKLLTSGEDSDVTVQVGDVEFKVHRAILSARCPVLSAMFRHETEERETNTVKIDDCEPEVFGDFLQYLYTGSVQSLAEQNVFGLHRIADKYLADDLKQRCLEHIKDTLSVQTFCEAMKLALTHGESDLLQLAIEFATKNLPLIICTVEWQNFNCEYPREANEILIKCICPRS